MEFSKKFTPSARSWLRIGLILLSLGCSSTSQAAPTPVEDAGLAMGSTEDSDLETAAKAVFSWNIEFLKPPKGASANLARSIAQLNMATQRSAQDCKNQVIEAYKEESTRPKEDRNEVSGSAEGNVVVVFENNSVFVADSATNYFCNDAHGSEEFTSLNFSKVTDSPIDLEKLLGMAQKGDSKRRQKYTI